MDARQQNLTTGGQGTGRISAVLPTACQGRVEHLERCHQHTVVYAALFILTDYFPAWLHVFRMHVVELLLRKIYLANKAV